MDDISNMLAGTEEELVSCKYDVGDSVYIISMNKVRCLRINGVFITVKLDEESGKSYNNVEYELNDIGRCTENVLFATKEELLKTL